MLSASAPPSDKPAPIAPSVARELKEQTNAKKPIPARLVPVPSLSGLADKRGEPMPDTTSSRSSPWSQSVAGGAARNPLEDNEITTVEPAILEPPKRAAQDAAQHAIRTEEIRRERWREVQNANETQEDQPSIARVGFTPGAPGAQKPPPPKPSSLPAKRPMARDATDTDQIPVGDLRGRARPEEQEIATEDTIDAATLAAQRLTRSRVPVAGVTEAVPQKKPALPPFPDAKRSVRSGSQTEELLANRPVQGNAGARAIEGELLTPLAQLAPNRFEEPVSETRLAAPGELAGREKKKQASETFAAPGELAGIMKNATRPPAPAEPRSAPPAPRPSPFDAPTNNLAARDVPLPYDARTELPVSKSSARNDLPTARGAHDLPTAKGVNDLPVSKSAHEGRVPASKSAHDQPAPKPSKSAHDLGADLTQSRASHDPRPADVRANDQRSVVPSRATAVPAAAPTPSRAAPPAADPRATRAQQPIFESPTKHPGAGASFEPRASDVQVRQPPQRTNPLQPAVPKTVPPAPRRDAQNLAPKGSILDPGETIAAPGALAGLVNDLGIAKPQVPAYRPQTSDLVAPPKIDLNAPAGLPGPPSLDSSLPMRTRTEPEAQQGARAMRGADTTDPELSADRTPPPRALTLTGEDSLDSGLLSMPGSALPAGDTLIPQRASDLMSRIEPNALTAAVAEPSVSFAVPGLARRLAADLIDLAVIGALVIAPISLGLFGRNLSAISWVDPDDVSHALISGAILFPAAIFLILVFVASSLSHALAGRSLGKLATGLELVVKKSGRRPSLVRTVIRALLGIVASLALGMSYLWLIVDRKSRTLHDVLSGTVPVISSSRREL